MGAMLKPAAGYLFHVGGYHATVLPDLDFETFSTAGYEFVPPGVDPKYPLGRWTGPYGDTKKKGLGAVGSRVYAEHPFTEVLTLSYDLKDGRGKRRWRPGLPLPMDLFAYLASGGLIEAHNVMFERLIWTFVCVRKYGFPPIDPRQLRCSMAKCRAYGLPGALGDVAKVLQTPVLKDADGDRLIKKFAMPRNPTQKDPRVRIRPEEEPVDGERLYSYCDTDIEAESEVSQRVPDLIPQELDYWLADQEINFRGCAADLAALHDCKAIIEQVLDSYGRELATLTGGIRPSQVEKLKGWLIAQGVEDYRVTSLDEESIDALLELPTLAPQARRALELRSLCASASVKKVFAMLAHIASDGRLHDMFIYHGARTGRDTHADVQPGNLPKAGPDIRWCESEGCRRPYAKARTCCPWCGTSEAFSSLASPLKGNKGWCWEAVESVLEVTRLRSMEALEYFFGDALLCVTGLVRSLFVAGPGMSLVSSDYASIESVVTAALGGEEWRLAAFERREDIYLHGAAAITGKTYEWYMSNGGKKHPDRQDVGKPGELGLGFGGWINAYRNFGGEGSDDEIRAKINAWRATSPGIVEAWGGQIRGKPWAPDARELFGLEGMAIAAVLNPGQVYTFGFISYQVLDDCLFAILPSGRRIAYQRPRLTLKARKDGWAEVYTLTYWTFNTNPNMGPRGWVLMETYGGKLFENAVQAVARDIMAFAVVNLERSGYPVVLRVHDELVSEIPQGFGSVTQFEQLMGTLPPWARGWPSDPNKPWPIRADGGWLSNRYRKD